ncbi:MAG: hypothetical protein BWY06_02346 [Candidatus Latescibacteria bacterium ADurb.Bin168]|nr:MAG: hypothetical protein BWY06_02346 [Candidatus Latescibacteria bacterium ADurb.Bin168]
MLKAFKCMLIIVLLLGVKAAYSDDLDVVYLKNGSRIVGVVVEMVPSGNVRIRTADGSEFVYRMDEVERIARVPAPQSAQERDLRAAPYYEIGVVLGTPGAINVVAGHWFGAYGTRISGGYVESGSDMFWGVQANAMKKLRDTPVSRHAVGLVAIVHRDERMENWILRKRGIYAGGVAYNYNWRGLFAETALTLGANTGYSNAQLLFQIGYMHRFLPKQTPSSR